MPLPAPSQAAIDRFADSVWIEDGLAPLTLAAYKRDLSAVRQPGWPSADMARPSMQAPRPTCWATSPERHGGTRATTANRRLSVFKRYFRWALREHRIDARIPRLRLLTARQPLRVPQAACRRRRSKRCWQAPDTDVPLGLRDRTMLELMYASGLRVSELVGLKTVHVGLNEGVLRVMGKGSKERLVPFGEEAHAWLRRWLAEVQGSRSWARAATMRCLSPCAAAA